MEGLDLYELLSPVVVLIITVLSGFLTKLIHEKTKNATLASILGRLNELVWDEVKAAEQVAVRSIKLAKDPSSDGGVKITDAEARKIKQRVLGRIKENVGVKGLVKLGKVLGLDSQGVTGMIESKIESYVLDVGSKVNP